MDLGALVAASGAPEGPNRPGDPLACALRPRIETPGPADSLRSGQAGEQQASRQIQPQIAGLSYPIGQQGLERPNIILGHRHISSAAAHQCA